MKIEKLTENKIRVILKIEDLKEKNVDIQTLMTPSSDSQELFLEMLSQAQREFGFSTDGYRLLIEGFSTSEDLFIFTITKYKENSEKGKNYHTEQNKKLMIKRKIVNAQNPSTIYSFQTFEEFCDFCDYLSQNKNITLKGLMHNSSLYLLDDTYYLLLIQMNSNHKSINLFYTAISEFGKPVSYLTSVEGKIKEYGNTIINRNAIYTGIKFFSSSK